MFMTADMLKIFAQYRGDAIVISGRGGRHWVNITDKPELDVPLGDPAMGGHAGFALGLALAALSVSLAAAEGVGYGSRFILGG